MPKKPANWSARFDEPPDDKAARFNASLHFDKRLAMHDIETSVAHAKMLTAQNIIGKKDGAAILRGLRHIRQEMLAGDFVWRTTDEDIHFCIERRLIEIIGEPGKRLHTARSRNDQAATDLRLFLRAQSDHLLSLLTAARAALLDKAKKHADTLTAGMTHLQVAQPITFGHHLLAYEDMLARDAARLTECRRRINCCPLGAGALAGVGYPIDREQTAAALGFESLCQNSMDAVSDRDFVVEFISDCSLLMIHLSRFCEEVIIWSSPAFGLVELPDSLCTGSSLMPQKKNPDVAELIRGKCGRVCGALVAVLMMMKSQPLSYNKDNQEDKEGLFDCCDTTADCLSLFTVMVQKMQVRADKMRRLLDAGYPAATELADELTRRGTPFKESHATVSAVVRDAATKNKRLEELTLAELQKHIPFADEKMRRSLNPKQAVARRNHIGGTAIEEVKKQIRQRQIAVNKSGKKPGG